MICLFREKNYKNGVRLMNWRRAIIHENELAIGIVCRHTRINDKCVVLHVSMPFDKINFVFFYRESINCTIIDINTDSAHNE